ncbi:unnamed protein product [Cylicostephanus goldi]|uniref:Uncharacterized protein n=1 Tax=Cylicostephanus goldi TaxID=71465 RepID=A0A3P7P0A1_CYLGO|nr:unnamed protein product [Cylicostephanus goldi]
MVFLFPEGMRGPGGPPIYPGLYAVVGKLQNELSFVVYQSHKS